MIPGSAAFALLFTMTPRMMHKFVISVGQKLQQQPFKKALRHPVQMLSEVQASASMMIRSPPKLTHRKRAQHSRPTFDCFRLYGPLGLVCLFRHNAVKLCHERAGGVFSSAIHADVFTNFLGCPAVGALSFSKSLSLLRSK